MSTFCKDCGEPIIKTPVYAGGLCRACFFKKEDTQRLAYAIDALRAIRDTVPAPGKEAEGLTLMRVIALITLQTLDRTR